MSAITGAAAPSGGVRPSDSVPLAGGWNARFYVSPAERVSGLHEDSIIRRDAALGVNAQFSRRIAPGTRLSIDIANAFDRRPPATAAGFAAPATGRALRIQVRKTF